MFESQKAVPIKRCAIKKATAFAVFAFFFSAISGVNADEIYLKDGRIIKVESCREKGNDYTFIHEGRPFFVNKEQVKKVVLETPRQTEESYGTKRGIGSRKKVVPSSGHTFDIDKYCKKVANFAGGSYQIEETCRQEESEAERRIDRMSIPSKVHDHCREVARFAGGSYQIMETCVKQEVAAKGRLGH